MVFVGIDWSEKYHDICIVDQDGEIVAKARVRDGIEGIARLHAIVAEHADEPEEAIVGIEADRGLLVGALLAVGYQVFSINPLSLDRYRDRHATSGAKSDPGDAKLLADIVRTDHHNHRPISGDSDLAEAIKLLARAHQGFTWERQRHVNRLRNALREFYPQALQAFGTELATTDAIAVLLIAPTPELGRALSRSKLVGALKRAGRRRKRRGPCGADPGCSQVRAAAGASHCQSRLRFDRVVAGGCDHGAQQADSRPRAGARGGF